MISVTCALDSDQTSTTDWIAPLPTGQHTFQAQCALQRGQKPMMARLERTKQNHALKTNKDKAGETKTQMKPLEANMDMAGETEKPSKVGKQKTTGRERQTNWSRSWEQRRTRLHGETEKMVKTLETKKDKAGETRKWLKTRETTNMASERNKAEHGAKCVAVQFNVQAACPTLYLLGI